MLLAPLLNGDPGPPPRLWTITALVLCPVSCWLAVTVANNRGPHTATGHDRRSGRRHGHGRRPPVCAQPVLHSIGWSAVAGGGATLVAVTQTWLPPVGLTLRSLNDSPAPTVTLAVQAVLGLALPAAASALTVVVHNRR